MIYRLVIFMLLNFGALAIGSIFTSKGVPSEWYISLVKAPWTPPGWVFGFAWTAIMICFSIYLAYLWPLVENKTLLVVLYIVQWMLNVGWNPTFFYFQDILSGLLIIVGLTIVVGFFLVYYWPDIKLKSILLLPYVFWLIIAISLNAYILIKN